VILARCNSSRTCEILSLVHVVPVLQTGDIALPSCTGEPADLSFGLEKSSVNLTFVQGRSKRDHLPRSTFAPGDHSPTLHRLYRSETDKSTLSRHSYWTGHKQARSPPILHVRDGEITLPFCTDCTFTGQKQMRSLCSRCTHCTVTDRRDHSSGQITLPSWLETGKITSKLARDRCLPSWLETGLTTLPSWLEAGEITLPRARDRQDHFQAGQGQASSKLETGQTAG
jgi:hypothetical protein